VRPRFRPRNDSGFTLLELMVVLAILGLLAAVAGPPMLRYLSSGKSQAAKIQITNLGASLDLYAYDVGAYPATRDGLNALLAKPTSVNRWNGPYLKSKDTIIDPWGNPYKYAMPGQHGAYDVYTLGPKGTEGGQNDSPDFRNW
jgi:general secretion pathway protein G